VIRSTTTCRGHALLAALAFAALAATTGCSGDDDSCPNDVPDTCDMTSVPSYQTDVAPIIDAHCTRCHAPGGSESSKDLSTYAGVQKWASEVLFQVSTCRMPPSGDAPSSDERQVLFAWLVCGAPDN
jgi:uncharacterized membrane protein